MRRKFIRTFSLLCIAAMLLAGWGAPSVPIVKAAEDSEKFIPGEVVVKLVNASVLPAIAAQYGLAPTPLEEFGKRPIYRLKINDGTPAPTKAAALAADTQLRVVYAEANYESDAPETSGVIATRQSWSVGDPAAYQAQWAPTTIHLREAQRVTRGASMIVAVLDTGVDRHHPALAGRLLSGYDFVDDDNDPSEVGSQTTGPYGHGTHVAGLIALAAPEAKILPIRVLDERGVGNVWVLAEALAYAADPDGNPNTDDGADVVNLSLSTNRRTSVLADITGKLSSGTIDDDDSNPSPVPTPEPAETNKGALVVVASGNGGDDVKQYPAAETGISGLLAVAASDSTDTLTSFSTRGSWVKVMAPGDGITSSVPGNLYGTWRGTSMAAPLAAGEAALIRAVRPDLSARAVRDLIVDTAPEVMKQGTVRRRIDAAAALASVGVRANPIEQAQFFVRQNYLDFFNRAPDESGFNFWTNQITSCGADAACIELKRTNVSAAFFLSIEFQQTGYLVYRLNRASFGSMPTYQKFMPDTQQIGEGIVVNSLGWEAKLEANKRAFTDAWVNRPEFHARYDGKSNEQFVSELFANAIVTPTAEEQTALVNALNAGSKTRAEVLRQIAENPSLIEREKNAAFVLTQYFGYLRRNPNDAPEPTLDFQGFNFWLAKLNQFGGDFVKADMVKSFIISGEYHDRFGAH